MPRDPYPTVLEYLRTDEPQVRRNAVAALAVLGRRPAARMLVEVAMDDRDPGVRERAEAELVQLPAAEAAFAEHSLEEFLRVPDRRSAAYALAGRLRNLGWPLRPRLAGPGERLLAANALHGYLHPDRDLRFRVRLAPPAFVAGILGSLLVLLTLMVLGIDTAQGIAATGWGLSALVALLVSQRATPAALQYDTVPGVAVELGWTALLTLFPGVLPVFAALWFSTDEEGGPLLAMTLLGMPLLAAAVRAATLVTGGAWGPRSLSRWMALLAGTGAGWLAATGLYVLWAGRGRATGDMWAMCLIISIALAAVFAAVDADGRPRRSILGWGAHLLGPALAAVAVVPVATLLVPRMEEPVRPPALVRTAVPDDSWFQLDSAGSVGVAVLASNRYGFREPGSSHDYRITVFRGYVQPVARGERLRPELEAGRYRVSVGRAREDPAAAVLAHLRLRLAPVLAFSPASRDSAWLEVAPLDGVIASEYENLGIRGGDLALSADFHLRYGNVALARALLDAAERSPDREVMGPERHSLCWHGTLSVALFRHPYVRRACGGLGEVEANPAPYRAARGLNRMRNGDGIGAAADFAVFLQAAPDAEPAAVIRLLLGRLRRGENRLEEHERSALLGSSWPPDPRTRY